MRNAFLRPKIGNTEYISCAHHNVKSYDGHTCTFSKPELLTDHIVSFSNERFGSVGWIMLWFKPIDHKNPQVKNVQWISHFRKILMRYTYVVEYVKNK